MADLWIDDFQINGRFVTNDSLKLMADLWIDV
jgi:hypothetical protein